MEPTLGIALLKAAYPSIVRRVMGLITDQVNKPLRLGKEKFLRAMGHQPPALAEVLQNVIAKAYVTSVDSIVNDYLREQSQQTLRASEDIKNEEVLRERLKALKAKKLYEIAPSIETIDILPIEPNDNDRVLQQALIASVKEALGNLPKDLEGKFDSTLIPTLTENIWHQISKSLDEAHGNEIVFAFLFNALSGIGESSDNTESFAREAVQRIIELSAQLSAQQQEIDRARQDFDREIQNAREGYRNWILESNKTFFVPGLDIRLPITEAWDQVLIDAAARPYSGGESLARQISRYHEWERLGDNARRSSHVWDADAALIGKQFLVIVGGPGAGKSTLARRLTVWATNKGVAMRVSLKRVARLLKEGISFDTALLTVALDGSGIPAEVGKLALASPDYLIADGLDECDPDRSVTANHLTTWASGHPNCHVCVMTRPVGHTASLLPSFSHAELLPLSDTAISDFAEKLIGGKVDDVAHREHLTSEFTRLVIDNKEETRLASIAARNPLLLSFLIALFLQDKPLTNRRAELFEQIIDLIKTSPMSDRISTVEIDIAVAERVIEVVAWHVIHTPDIDFKSLSGSIAQDLELQLGTSQLEAMTLAQKGLNFWEERRLIERLRVGPTEAYAFVHLILQEYLAGLYISRMKDDDLRLWLLEARREVLWRQPILLACGAGATERIVPALLEMDDPTELTSIEAMIAASCLAEAGHVKEHLAEQVTTKLQDRLTSRIPLIAIEAGEGLRQLALLAPKIVSTMTVDLEGHEQEWTRLAAFTVRLAAGGRYATLDQCREWLKQIQFVRMLHFTGEPAEKRISDLPQEAYDLQEFAFVMALGRLFEELEREDARTEATKYLKQIRHSLTSRLLNPLESMLHRYDSLDIIDAAFEDDLPRITLSPDPWRNSDGSSPDVILIETIIAAAQSIGKDETTLHNSQECGFTSLSILISAFRFLKVEYTVFDAIATQQEQEPFQEVLRTTIVALGLEPGKVIAEAQTALAKLRQSDETHVWDFIQNIPVSVKWSRAKNAKPDVSKLVRALGHPSWVVVEAAANVLLQCTSEQDIRQLFLGALQIKGKFTLVAVAGLVPRLWQPQEAARILLDRLKEKPASGFGHIYKALGSILFLCDESIRGEVAKALFDGLYAEEHAAALAAAEVLSALPLRNSQKLQELLRRAFDYWMERVGREDREAPAHVTGTGENRSRFRVVEPDPLVTLLKLLTKLKALDTEDLLTLSSAKEPGIAGEAIIALTNSTASDQDLLRSLLTKIRMGLAPYPSSTTLNLFQALLKLPAKILEPVRPELLAVGESEIPAIRARLISSLTSEWVPVDIALQVAQAGIDDPIPGVRNSAVRTIRLLRPAHRPSKGQSAIR